MGFSATAAPAVQWRTVCSARFQHTAMLEGLLLLLLAIGGNEGAPAAGIGPATASPTAVIGVWRGTWAAPGKPDRVPVEAVVEPAGRDGRVAALLSRGGGASRRTIRVVGKLAADGVHFEVPGGGFVRLAAFSGSRLVGDIRGVRTGGPLPGDGDLDLARVRR